MQDTIQNIDVLECSKALKIYGDLAASEAITRALVNERSGKREKAIFWMEVFYIIVNDEFEFSNSLS